MSAFLVKLDENLALAHAEFLRQLGHAADRVTDEQLSGAEDAVVWQRACSEGRFFITLDLDFGNPLVFKPWEYFGIAVLHLPSKPSPHDLRFACLTLVRALEQSNISGKLWSVQRGRVREYQPDRPEEENE